MLKLKRNEGGSWLALASGDDASPWVKLSNGVILQAVEDYRKALAYIVEKEAWLESEDGGRASQKQRASVQRKIVSAWKDAEEVERFFRSSRCRMFTELDMVVIGKRIKAEFPDIELYE